MLFLLKLNPEYSSKLLVEAKGTCAMFLFLLAAKKKAFIVSFRWDTKILTADRTAGSAAVCKEESASPHRLFPLGDPSQVISATTCAA